MKIYERKAKEIIAQSDIGINFHGGDLMIFGIL
jgi:hypothetical protein